MLLVHGANPVYSLPRRDAASRDALAQGEARRVASRRCPTRPPSARTSCCPITRRSSRWGDAAPRAGRARARAADAAPALRHARARRHAARRRPRDRRPTSRRSCRPGSFRSVLEAAWAGADFARGARRRGGVLRRRRRTRRRGSSRRARLELAAPRSTARASSRCSRSRTRFLYDGRGANLPLAPGNARPVTKSPGQSWAETQPRDGRALGVELGDVLAVETPAGAIELPALPRGGIRDDVIAIRSARATRVGHLRARTRGQGVPGERARRERDRGAARAASTRRGGRAWLTEKAKVAATGAHQRLPLLQWQRQPARAPARRGDHARGASSAGRRRRARRATTAGARDAGRARVRPGHGRGHGEAHERTFHEQARTRPTGQRLPLGHDDRPRPCTGLQRLHRACYVENNIPRVGEDEVRRVPPDGVAAHRALGRRRRARAEAGRGRSFQSREKLGDVDVRNAPMLCQHCGAAPCEPVCPVFATYHNAEGLNGDVYNRCVGTRYCANNCPYKVRRFNYFDYQIERWPEPLNLVPQPGRDGARQGRDGEVHVLRAAHPVGAPGRAKDEKRAIADGEVTTACAQACPTERDRVRQPEATRRARSSQGGSRPARGYHALHELNTRPAVTYLAKVDARRGRRAEAMTPPPAESVAAMIRPDAGAVGLEDQPRPPRACMDGASASATCCCSALLAGLVRRRRRRLDLPDLQGPRHRRLHAPGVLGRVHRHVRVLGRHRARRHADLGDPLPVPRQVAQRDQPQRRGDDGVRGHDRGAVPRHPPRPHLEVLLHPSVPEPARRSGRTSRARWCGTCSRSPPTPPSRSCSSTSA